MYIMIFSPHIKASQQFQRTGYMPLKVSKGTSFQTPGIGSKYPKKGSSSSGGEAKVELIPETGGGLPLYEGA